MSYQSNSDYKKASLIHTYFCDTCIQNYNGTHICKKEVLVWLSILEKKKIILKKTTKKNLEN